MKKLLMLSLLIAFACSTYASAESTWTKIGLTGGNIADMESFPSNPDIMLACVAEHGIYRSTNRGDYWSQIIPDVCYDISISEDDVAYVAGDAGVQVSHDFGETWETVSDIAASQVVAHRDGIVAANTTDSHGIIGIWYLSYNNGYTWEQWEGTERTTSVLFHHDGNVYRTTEKDIYRAELNNLSIWALIKDNSWSFTPDLHFSFSIDDTILVAYSQYVDQHPIGYQPGGVYYSYDNGMNWELDDNYFSVTSLTQHNSTLIIGSNASAGAPYTLMTTHVDSLESTAIGTFGSEITAIDTRHFDNGEIFVSTKGGIFKTSDNGNTWYKSDTGILHIPVNSVQVTTLETDIDRIVISTKEDGIYYSDDMGKNWISAEQEARTIPGLLMVSPSDPSRIYAAEASIYMSENYGESWEKIIYVPVGYYDWYGRTVYIDVNPQDANRIIMNYSSHSIDNWNGIFFLNGEKTEDESQGWEWEEQQEWFDNSMSFRSQFSEDGETIWISRERFVTVDQAFLIQRSRTGEIINSIILPGNNLSHIWSIDNQYCYAFNERDNRFLVSPDLGANWSSTDLVLDDYVRYNDWAAEEPLGDIILSPNKSTIFLLYPGNGILASKDNGETWEHFDEGIDTEVVYQLAFSLSDHSVMYAATDNGLFRCDTPEIVHADESNDVPLNISLLQSYPNPFNPTTSITYTLPVSSPATLSVYSVTGQKMVTLVDEPMVAGVHTVQFDGAGLASGVYFARLEAGGAVETRKMLLVK